MNFVVLYFATLVVFLAIDALGLRFILRPLFEQNVGELLLDEFRLAPALIFYSFYIGCVLWFVSAPALQLGHSWTWVFASGALLGAMAYGTYEFTNLATLRAWTWRMVVADVAWGTVLTAVSAAAGLGIARALAPRLSS